MLDSLFGATSPSTNGSYLTFSSTLSSAKQNPSVYPPQTPNMSHLLKLGSGITNSNISYCVPVTLLHDQIVFNTVLSTKHHLYGHHTILNDNDYVKGDLSYYTERCIFDVFLSISYDDYAGSDNLHSSRNIVHESVKRILR